MAEITNGRVNYAPANAASDQMLSCNCNLNKCNSLVINNLNNKQIYPGKKTLFKIIAGCSVDTNNQNSCSDRTV